MAALEGPGLEGRVVELEGDRVNIGRSVDNGIVIKDDSSVSRHHVKLERAGSTWYIHDLNSANGTYVNGERMLGERPLRHSDEITLGRTRLVFYGQGPHDASTDRTDPKPTVTRREFEVLVELCRPVLSANALNDAASVRDIADRLFVGEAAVKAHLGRLCDKFGIDGEGRNRRRELANRAIETGVVSRRDLETDTRADDDE